MAGTPLVNNFDVNSVSKARRFVRSFATRSLIPILLTEACVEAGRTYNAYKRGGFTEARERLTEEFTSAVVWMGGVPFFDFLIDKFVGKKLLQLPGDGFSVGKDAARNPVANYIHSNVFKGKTAEQVENMLGKFRAGKLVTSLALATATVGILLPKMNQAITRYMKKNSQNKPQHEQQAVNQATYNNVTMDEFMNKKDVSFTGALNGAKLMNFVNTFETTPKYQLLTEDGGVLVGRTGNARNKYEAIEIGFRDGSSCYFYMFNTPVMAAMFNKLIGGSRIDPVASEAATRHLVDMIQENGGQMTAEAFEKAALGDASLRYKITPELERLITKNGGRIEFEKLIELYPELKGKEDIVRRMSELQPKMFLPGADGKMVAKNILTKTQVEDLFIGGKANSPEFLHDIYTVQSTPDQIFKVGKPAYKDSLSYVKQSELEGAKKNSRTFVEDIINAAKKKGEKITKELIEKENRKVFYKQAFSWGTSFAVSILFLSMLIPKAQYWITRKLTGSDSFPGTAEYDDKKAA